MNNNRGNNRRRGRGNNNGNRQQGGGQQLNRIDSRARGNAPQLLEKYRKLAHDAHLNGDRVTEEYNLQFADHYFRVIADQRQRQEEQRQRRDERWQDGGNENEREDNEFGSDYAADDYTAYDQPHRREREDRPQRQDDRGERAERADRNERPDRSEREPEARGGETAEDSAGDGERSPYEPVENPFVREGRSTRGLRPRRETARDGNREGNREERRPRRERDTAAAETAPAFDASVLPPAISVSREEPAEAPAPAAAEEAEAKPRRRTRKPKPPAGETLETVG